MTNGDEKTPDTSANNSDIVDAEVIIESDAPQTASDSFAAPSPVNSSKSASKAGWISAAILAAFIGGLFSAPYAQLGLRYLGLIPIAPSTPTMQNGPVDLVPLQEALADTQAQLRRHQEILANHESSLAKGAEQTGQLKSDLARAVIASATKGTNEPALATEGLSALQTDVARLTEDLKRLASLKISDTAHRPDYETALALLKAENDRTADQFTALQQAFKQLQAGAIEASPRGRLLLALGKIKDLAMKGFSYGPELEALRTDMAALPALDQQLLGAELSVLSNAKAGITPYETLVQDFEAVAAASLQAAQKEEGGFLSSLFTVRRTDAGATGNDAIFRTAEKRLTVRNVSGAVETLETLEGAAFSGTADWRKNARLFVDVERALNRLTAGVGNTANTYGAAQ